MKTIVFHGVGDIRLDDVPEPKIKAFDTRQPRWLKVKLQPGRSHRRAA